MLGICRTQPHRAEGIDFFVGILSGQRVVAFILSSGLGCRFRGLMEAPKFL